MLMERVTEGREKQRNRKETTEHFGNFSMRSQVSYRAAQEGAKAANLESVSGSSIHRYIQLGDRHQLADTLRELGIGDQEGGDLPAMQLHQNGIDLRIHDGLPHK